MQKQSVGLTINTEISYIPCKIQPVMIVKPFTECTIAVIVVVMSVAVVVAIVVVMEMMLVVVVKVSPVKIVLVIVVLLEATTTGRVLKVEVLPLGAKVGALVSTGRVISMFIEVSTVGV